MHSLLPLLQTDEYCHSLAIALNVARLGVLHRMGNELGQLYLGFLYRQSHTHPTFLTGRDGAERRTLAGLVIPRCERVAYDMEENNAVAFDGEAA